jgi:tetratricopeptide (TPR) repeat protein
MRFLPFALTLIIAAAPLPSAAFAQDADITVEDAAPADPAQEQPQADEAKAPTTDELFMQLAHETNKVAARRIAQQIITRFNESGSATIDLLMGRAAAAMTSDKPALAEDMLTQVIVLAPEFAEGWNRRATLHYTTGDIGGSIADIEKVLELEPRHFGALSGLAAIMQRMGEDRKALDIWYKVLAIYPAYPEAQQAVQELEDKLAGERA